MTIDILLHDVNHPITLICSYAHTSKATVQVRNKFYTQLSQLVSPSTWLLGDFNARIGRRSLDPSSGIDASNTIGPWSLKNGITPNSNGMLLLNLVSEHNLRHVSSHFQFRQTLDLASSLLSISCNARSCVHSSLAYALRFTLFCSV